MNKAYEFRIYPTLEQEILIKKTIGSARKVYNLMLADNNRLYEETKKGKLNSPTVYKNQEQYLYLKEVDSLALCSEWMHLKTAFTNFFKHGKGKPVFKSKKNNKQSYTTNNINNNIRFEDGRLKLPKVGFVSGVFHRFVEGIIKSVAVKMRPNGHFYVSILTEQKSKVVESQLIKDEKVLGIDMSMQGFGVTSNGEKFNPPKWLQRSHKKLGRLQRKLARRKVGSKRRDKQRIAVATLMDTVANQRKDWLNKLSFKLAEENDVVVVEDINLKSMAHRFGKSISDNGFGQFSTMLEYKLNARLKTFVKADKFFASTQTCSVCGYKNKEVSGLSNLDKREWICPECGSTHDRDINAAKNLVNYYLEKQSTDAMSGIDAHGDCVRPEDAEAQMAVIDKVRKVEGHSYAVN